MGVGNLMARFKPGPESQFSSQAPTPARADSTVEKDEGIIDDSPVKYLTWRSFILGLCVSMGGFIFGYSTGKLALHALSHGTGYPAQSVHGN
jgi:SP family sugar:H+ symporter-like MFS transporter